MLSTARPWRWTALLVLLLLVGAWAPRPAAAGPIGGVSDEDAARQAAADLLTLETLGAVNAVYDRLHPDAKAEVPRAAVVGVLAQDLLPRGPGAGRVTGVAFGAWTWPVTGAAYPRAAAATFTRPVAGGEETGTLHLAKHAGTWRPFWGADRAAVAAAVARFVPPIPPREEGDLFGWVVADLDAFWDHTFDASGLDTRTPTVRVFDGKIRTECGVFRPWEVGPFYCPPDDTIYLDQEMNDWFESYGEFTTAVVMAHEWGHHLQTDLGIIAADGSIAITSRDLELMADCLAGVWTLDADARGLLVPGDVLTALELANAIGDPVGIPEDHPGAHGSGEERAAAFALGYEDGIAGCLPDFPDVSALVGS